MKVPDLSLLRVPVIAILRGIEPANAVPVAEVIYEAGIQAIEVPLNSPSPYDSISALAGWQSADCLIGAGTVLTPEEVQLTQRAGGQIAVSPNCDPTVIAEALRLGLLPLPGISTATEAFLAVHAGAQQLKLFPAGSHSPKHLQALRSVLPTGVRVYPVGGIGAQDIKAWLNAGANGFGFGSELFRPEFSLSQIRERSRNVVQAFEQAVNS